jgi:gliding motility-associated-like protein
VNDRWIIDNIDTYGDCTVQIFNRWGVKVYDQAGYNNTWEGTNQAGEPLPDGVYYYVISFKGNPRQYSGAINILRNQQ